MLAETAQLAVNLHLGTTGSFSGATSQLKGVEAAAAGASGRGISTLQAGFGRASLAAGKFGGALGHAKSQVGGLLTGPAGIIGLGAGVFGLVGALDSTVNASRDFAAAMERIHTQADATQTEVDSMSKSILDMAASVGTSPLTLSQGLYHLESAGFRGAVALNALKVAAQGAKVGNANLEDVTNALDAVLVAGGKDAKNMSGSMGELNAIVGSGDMKMQDLADALGTGLLAAARTFGLSLQDVGAALATLGDNNIRGSEAATKLRMSISLMGAPSHAAAKALKEIGLSAVALNEDMQTGGLIKALEDLKSHLDGLSNVDLQKITGQSMSFIVANRMEVLKAAEAQILTHAFGGGKSSTTIQLLLEQLDRVKNKYVEIGKGSTAFGSAWAATVQTAQFKWDKFNTALGVTGVKVGNVLVPLITDAMGYLGDALTRHEKDIVAFAQGAAGAFRSIGGVIKNTVVPAVKFIGGAWMSLPSQLRDLLIGGFLANKAVKWTFGFDVVGSISDVIKKAVMSGLGVKFAESAIGKAFVQPVFVTNPGFGSGGGLPALPGAAAAGIGAAEGVGASVGVAGLSTLLPLALPFVLALAPAVIRSMDPEWDKNHPLVTHGQMSPKGGGATMPGTTSTATTALQQQQIDAIKLASRDTIGGVDQAAAKTVAGAELNARRIEAAENRTGMLVNSSGKVLAKQAAASTLAFRAVEGQLKHAKTADQVKAAIKAAMTTIFAKSLGGTDSTGRVLRDLKAQLSHTHDPKLEAALRAAIGRVETKLASRQIVADQLKVAQHILHSSESTKQKIAELKAVEQRIGDRSKVAIARVEHAIEVAKRAQVIASKLAGHEAAAAIKDKDLSVTVNVKTNISARNFTKALATSTKFGIS